MIKHWAVLILTFGLVCFAGMFHVEHVGASAQLPAFPGAQGGGAQSVGGRGGIVYNVTSLADTTNSSCTAFNSDKVTCTLRDCVSKSGPRYCIFRLFGLITQKSANIISHGNLTIPGQSAPGEIVQGGAGQNGQALAIETPEVIIRYLTYDGASSEASGSTCNHDTGTVGYEILDNNNFNIVIDHTSHRWWGNKDMEVVSNGPNQNAHDLTISDNLLYEPCFDHPVVTEPDVFGGGSQFASVNQDWHHNLAINYDHRWPLGAIRSMRWVNNNGFNGIQNSDSFNTSFWGAVQLDVIGSNYEDGPNSTQPVFNIAIQPDPTSSLDEADCNPTCDNGPAQGRAPTLYLLNNQGHPGKTVNIPSIPVTNVPNDQPNVSMLAQVTNAEGAFNPTMPPSAWLRPSPLPTETFPIVADQVTDFDTKTLPAVGNSQHLDCLGNWVANRDSQDLRVIAQYRAKGKGGPWEGPTYSGPAFGGGGTPPGGAACVESMHDGLPDLLKQKLGISLTDPNIYKAIDPNTQWPYLDGYLGGLYAGNTPVAPTVNCAPATVAPGASSVCGANQSVTWSASAGNIAPTGLFIAPMTPATVTVTGTNTSTNMAGQTPVTVAVPGAWSGWLGADALPGAAIGKQVVIGPTAGQVRSAGCGSAAPISPQPTNYIGTTVTVIGGPASCNGGIQFWQVQSGSTPPPAHPTVSCAPTSVPTSGTSTCTSNQQVTWSASAGTITAAGIFTAPSTAQAVTITGTNANGSGATPITVTAAPPPNVWPTVTLAAPGIKTTTCTFSSSANAYVCAAQ